MNIVVVDNSKSDMHKAKHCQSESQSPLQPSQHIRDLLSASNY